MRKLTEIGGGPATERGTKNASIICDDLTPKRKYASQSYSAMLYRKLSDLYPDAASRGPKYGPQRRVVPCHASESAFFLAQDLDHIIICSHAWVTPNYCCSSSQVLGHHDVKFPGPFTWPNL